MGRSAFASMSKFSDEIHSGAPVISKSVTAQAFLIHSLSDMLVPRSLSSPALNLKYRGSFVVPGLIDATSKAGLAVTAACGRSGAGTMAVPAATAITFCQIRRLKEHDG